MARCLVTGHRGYIGSKLFKKLKLLGHEAIGIDLNEDIPKDINKTLVEDTDGKFHPYYVNFQHPVLTTRNNILAGTNILNFARKVGSVKRVIYSSSSSVVGNGNGPASPYALQKYTTELETTMYSHLYGLDTVSLRYFNVYSHDQRADGPYATAVANWMRSIREGTNPYITGDGNQRRDMVNVEDVVAANIFCMNYGEPLNGAVFDVGTGDNISLNEISEIVKTHFPNSAFDHVEPRKGDVLMTRADTTGLAELGWNAKVTINKGISDCFGRLK